VLPNKPTSRGVCLKTIWDASARVMVAMEIVEAGTEQGIKRYAEEWRSAAVCVRLTEPRHNNAPRILIANAWFGGMPLAVSLLQRNIYCITNVKLQTKHFCKRQLWADARGTRATHERNDRAYRQPTLKVNGKDTKFTGAFHMDRNAPLGEPAVLSSFIGFLSMWNAPVNLVSLPLTFSVG
jgi:hypothetical protein